MLLFLAIILTIIAYSQTYQINFSGSGATEDVEIVEIYDLTQESSIIVNGNDIVNFQVISSNIKPHYQNTLFNSGILIYPNPTNNNCSLEFIQNSQGLCQLSIVDILGKSVFSKSDILSSGIHTYEISGLRTGLYFVQVNTPDDNYSVKLISRNTENNCISAELKSSQSLTIENTSMKNSKTEIEFEFMIGDLILFKATSGIYSTVYVTEINEDMTIEFEFIQCTDADNNNYAIVPIGANIWMYENLATTTYLNTDIIPNTTAPLEWSELVEGAYVWYDNNIANKDIYGALYNWYAVETQQLCPEGWHVPEESEWSELINFAGGVLIAGGKLKQTTTDLWTSPNLGATNEFGFSALPGGERLSDGSFVNINNNGIWWTSSDEEPEAIMEKMFYDSESTENNSAEKTMGYSVRCILDCDDPIVEMAESADICHDISNFVVNPQASNYSSLIWTTDGDGSFSDNTELNPIYSFGSDDYTTGSVTLTLTASPLYSCASPISKNLLISLHPDPTITIDTEDTLCVGEDVILIAQATYYEETFWDCVNCNAEIDFESEEFPVYSPSDLDFFVGYNDFVFTATAISPCNKTISKRIRIYYLSPNADAGPDQIDLLGTETNMLANDPDPNHTGLWTTEDPGSFSNSNNPHSGFSGVEDITYDLIWTITDENGCQNSDTVVVKFAAENADSLPCQSSPTITDIDGNTYNTVKIGSQCWMRENLKSLPTVNGPGSGSETDAIYYVYGYNGTDVNAAKSTSNFENYGVLYNWTAATTACPSGWHLPDNSEWNILMDYLQGYNNAGEFMKSTRTDPDPHPRWNTGNIATNSSGFTAFPGGFRHSWGSFYSLGELGYWWTATDDEGTNAISRYMNYGNTLLSESTYDNKAYGYSVRCIKNPDTIPIITTLQIKPISWDHAITGGHISFPGSSDILQRGVVIGLSSGPTIETNEGITYDGDGAGAYKSNLNLLLPETTYFVRAYATNNEGTSYGQELSFTTSSNSVPTVDYHSVFNITSSTAKTGGTINDPGGDAVTKYGIIWSTNPNVDIDNYQQIIALNESTSIFDTTMTELIPLTTYYVRAFAINSFGIGYADIMTFSTLEPGNGEHCFGQTTFTDPRDGYEYKIVSIGTRCWMSENLKYLPDVYSFIYNNDTDPRYYVLGYHNNEPDLEAAKMHPNYQNYGVLYNYPAAIDACPEGYHLPTQGEWQDLINFLNNKYFGGNQLKSCRSVNTTIGGNCNTTEHPRWDESLDTQQYLNTDDYGFSALPGGCILYEDNNWGFEINPGYKALWWMFTLEGPTYYSETFGLDLNNAGYIRGFNRDNAAFSVRCVKD